MQPHRIVIIGTGAIGHLIARAVGELPNAQLLAGSGRSQKKGEAFADQYNCRWYADADQMLEHEKPQVALICTPSGAHLEGALACARHKVHVLCEKPLEITSARVKQMIDAAHSAGIVLGGFFPQRFNPPVRAIHQAAVHGRFGPLAVISASVPWWREDSYYGGGRWQGTLALDGGGALMNQSIHYIDLMQWLAASTMPQLPKEANPVEEVFAYTAKRAHDSARMEVEDTAVATLRFRNGALGLLLGATSMYPGNLRRLHVAGRDGMAELLEDELLTWQFRHPQPEDEQIRVQFSAQTRHPGGSHDPMAITHMNHRYNIAEFLDALESQRPPALSGEEAAKAVAIIEACYQSARTGQPISL